MSRALLPPFTNTNTTTLLSTCFLRGTHWWTRSRTPPSPVGHIYMDDRKRSFTTMMSTHTNSNSAPTPFTNADHSTGTNTTAPHGSSSSSSAAHPVLSGHEGAELNRTATPPAKAACIPTHSIVNNPNATKITNNSSNNSNIITSTSTSTLPTSPVQQQPSLFPPQDTSHQHAPPQSPPRAPDQVHGQQGGPSSASAPPPVSVTDVSKVHDTVSKVERVPIREDALDIPPPLGDPLRARVEHYVVHEDGKILPTLCALLGASQAFAERLVWFGAVYYCRVVPAPGGGKGRVMPTGLGEGEGGDPGAMARLTAQRAAGVKRWGKGTDKSTPRRVVDLHVDVHAAGYIRAHVYPKRFPAVYQVSDWHSRILHVTPHFVAVDKPPGVQVPPTVDNLRESLMSKVEEVLGLVEGSLSPPHRLDAGTQGVVLLAKTQEFSRHMRQLLSDKSAGRGVPREGEGAADVEGVRDGSDIRDAGVTSLARKTYRCVTLCDLGPPPLGRLVHWVELGVRVPGLPEFTRVLASRDQCPDAKTCEMIIIKVEEVCLSDRAISSWGCQSGNLNDIHKDKDNYKDKDAGVGDSATAAVGHDGVCTSSPPSPPSPSSPSSAPRAYQTTIQLVTGRTHQIRAQMAAIGRPLLGDALYTHLMTRGLTYTPIHTYKQEDEQQQEGERNKEQQQEEKELQCHVDGGDVVSGADKDMWVPGATELTAETASTSVRKGASSSSGFMDRFDALRPIGLQAWRMELPCDPIFFPVDTGGGDQGRGGGGGEGGNEPMVTFTAGPAWWTRETTT